jgi:DNA transformation protein
MSLSRSIRLSHLVNIGAKTEHLLNEVDIWTQQELQEIGPVEAWKRIKERHPEQARLDCLYALQGALLGVPWHKLPEDVVDELLAGVASD